MQNHPISPVRVSGADFDGWALAPHTEKTEARPGTSVTRRSAAADAMYRYRYQAESSLLPEIAQRFALAVTSLFASETSAFNGIIMVPPPLTRSDYAPVVALITEISRRTAIPSLQFAVQDQRRQSAEEERQRVRAFAFSSPIVSALFAGKRLLVLDDIFRSGRSLNTFCTLIKQEGKAAEVKVVVGTMVGINPAQEPGFRIQETGVVP